MGRAAVSVVEGGRGYSGTRRRGRRRGGAGRDEGQREGREVARRV